MRYKILDMLKSSHDFVSGEEIGARLHVSRAAVWKGIARLKEEGYLIESVSKRGYRLVSDSNTLNKYEIAMEKLVFYDTVDSTNNMAKTIAADGGEHGLIVACNRQTGGKGRLGRSWEDRGENLCFSLVLRPDIPPFKAPEVTLVTGLAVADALKCATGLDIAIKWPNDLVYQGKKLCGILTEMSAEMERVNYVVVGIGINANNTCFEGELKDKATSLALALSRQVSRSEVLRICSDYVFRYYDRFCRHGLEAFIQCYNDKCINVGKDVKAISRNNVIMGTALGINQGGALIIQGSDGELHEIFTGEVSLRLQNDNYV